MTACEYRIPILAWVLLALGVTGCAGGGSVRGATSVVVAVKACPEVTNLVAQTGTDWAQSFGLDSSDAATLKEGLAAARAFETHAVDLDAKLRDACSGLASNLGTPIVAATGDEACGRASEVLTKEKARLGAAATVEAKRVLQCAPGCADPCDLSAPKGPCAKSTVSVQVSGAADAEAAARYKSALDVFLPALAATADAESDVRGVIANARTAIEIGLVTGRAVSDGDIASAASAAVCILPPLLSAKQRISALRKDLRALGQIATLAGFEIPRPDLVEAPIASHTAVGRGRPPIVPPPLSDRIENLFTFPDGGFAAQTRGKIVALPSAEVLLDLEQRAPGEAPGQLYCGVGRGRRVACIRDLQLFDNKGRHLGAQIRVYDSAAGTQLAASVGGNDQLVADGIGFDASGTLLYAYTQTQVRPDHSMLQSSLLVRGGQRTVLPWHPKEASLEDLGSGGRTDPPIRFFEFMGREQLLYRDGRTLLLTPLDHLGTAAHIAERTAYDSRPVVGGDGVLYIFYYEPKSRTARVAHSSDGVTFADLILDTRESGWQLDAIPSEDGAIAVYYYFRNTYNKGLRAAALHGGRLVHPPASLMREDRWNAGWHVNLVSDHGHDVWLTYLSNVEADTRVWSHFGAPSELLDYAMLDTETEEDSYKNWFVQVGAGVWYTFWALKSKAPAASAVDGAIPHDASYKVDPTLLLTANLEARYGPVDLGLSYAQNYIDKAAKSLGNTTRVLSGDIKIDDLLPGHDVKAEGVWGRYHGRATRNVDAAPTEQLDLDTNYVDIHLMALNQWRIKYGLAFAKYTVPTPVQAYYAPANATHFLFSTSALRDVHYNDIELAVGYSKLDYVAKYENSYFGPIADITLAGGITLATFDAIPTPAGDLTSSFGFHARGNLLLGWLWMDRFRALAGLGIYVRPSYAVEGGLSTSGLGRPKDREQKDSEKAATESTFSLLSLRHGPWLDAGIVW